MRLHGFFRSGIAVPVVAAAGSSSNAGAIVRTKGIERVEILCGGMEAWIEQRDPG